MAADYVLPSPSCPLTNCPLGLTVAVHDNEIQHVKADVVEIKGSIERIDRWTVRALGALVLLCLGALFRILLRGF